MSNDGNPYGVTDTDSEVNIVGTTHPPAGWFAVKTVNPVAKGTKTPEA